MSFDRPTHGSLFSGIGGFDLAAEWAGIKNLFHCEIEEFPRKILKYYWEDAKSYEDITKTDFTIWRGKIDLLSGGFPCQPFSQAGKRKGEKDDRYLWAEMLRAISEIKPKWVIAENVSGLLTIESGLVFEKILSDLESEGYEIQPFIIPAVSKDAPHRRDRVWIIAYNPNGGTKRMRRARKNEICRYKLASKPCGQRCHNRSDNWQERQIYKNQKWNTKKSKSKRNEWKRRVSEDGSNELTPNTISSRHRRFAKTSRSIKPNGNWLLATQKRHHRQKVWGKVDGYCRASADHSSKGLERSHRQKSESANSPRFNTRENWQNFPTQPPICGGDDGLPSELDGITFPKWRRESIKGFGNAIVPQIAYEIMKGIREIENET